MPRKDGINEMQKFLAILAAVFFVATAVFGVLFFAREGRIRSLTERNRVLEIQSTSSRIIAEKAIQRLGSVSGDLEQLRTIIEQLRDNNNRVTAELDRYRGWIADYFESTGAATGEE